MNNQEKLKFRLEKVMSKLKVNINNESSENRNCTSCPPGWWTDSLCKDWYHISKDQLSWGDSQDKF